MAMASRKSYTPVQIAYSLAFFSVPSVAIGFILAYLNDKVTPTGVLLRSVFIGLPSWTIIVMVLYMKVVTHALKKLM
jgi:hypothetical protein